MRIHHALNKLFLSLLLLVLVYCGCVYAESSQNPAYEFYFQQLDANQQAMYRAILSAPAETATYTLVLPEDGGSYENVFAKMHTTMEPVKMDHPETTAWLRWFSDLQYDADSNSMTYTLDCQSFYDPDDQTLSEKLLDVIAAQADPTWDSYTKAWFVSNVVQDALDYDWDYVFYNENGKADFYNSNIFCVNNGYGICGGFSKLYKAIADRIGLPCVEVGSVGHAWVHVQMEDGNWYGQEPQNSVYLQGTSTMLGRSFIGTEDMYVLYDGFFDGGVGTSIHQPERVEYDYVYYGTAVNPGSVDLTQARLENTATTTTFEYSVNEDGTTCTITGFSGKESGDLVIPESIDGYTVTVIGNSAFTYANFDGTLTLPDSIVEIGNQAFAGCDRLTGQLILPANLKTIKSSAFIKCSGFTGEIVFNDNLETIGRGAFGSCTGLSGSLMLPDSITALETDSIYMCTGLDGVLHIPSGISEWSSAYVTYCDNLSGFDVSDDHPYYCVVDGILYSKDMTRALQCMVTKEGAVVLPEGVTVIGPQAFYQCTKITSISFPSTLKRIESWGCGYLTGLETAPELPQSLEYVGNNGFYASSLPGTLTIPQDIEMMEDAFGAMTNLKRLVLSEGVTYLPANAFQSGMSEVIFPATIIEIGENCFDSIQNLKIYGYPGTCAKEFVTQEKIDAWDWCFIPLVDGIALSSDVITIAADEEYGETQHQLSFIPQEITQLVIWASMDEAIATVTDGLVCGVAPGQTIITATFGDIQLQCKVTVHNGIQLNANGNKLIKVAENYSGALIIPEGVEVIGYEAITSGAGITSITFPSTLKSFENNSIYGIGYHSRIDLIFPASVETLGFGAIQNCRFVTLEYPINAKVENCAFSFCKIENLQIPEGVTTLPQYVFQYASITACYLPASLTSAPYTAFENAWVGTFYGYADTFAEQYVAGLQERYPDKNYVFVALERVIVEGDANDDSVVDIYDALRILQYEAGWDVTLNAANADMNHDGTVTMTDALLILQYCADGNLTVAQRMLKQLAAQLKMTVLEILHQPEDQHVTAGQQAQFTVTASGDELAYQWYIDRGDGLGWCKLNGATAAVHTTTAADPSSNGYLYRCVITDAYGTQLTSDTAELHVALDLPDTGDAASPMLWLALCLISAAGIALLRRKHTRA